MQSFRFIHTGDIHLDSPLKGLSGQQGAAAERIRSATRMALDNLVGHEPAHVFHTPDGHMMMNEYNAMHEEEANCFSGTLLLPREALLQAIRQGMSDGAMARYFGVSTALLRMRRNTTGVDKQLAYSR